MMQTTADAVDSGLLKFSTGAVIGTGGTIETPNQRIGVRNVLPIVTPADLARVPVTEDAGRPGAARRRRRRRRDAPAADRRRDHRRQARAAARRREAPVGEQPADDRGSRAGAQGTSAGPARDQVRHQGVPAGRLRQAGDRQPHPGAGARVHPGRGDPGPVPVRVAGGADQPAHHPAVAGRHDARALLARRHHQHHDAGRAGDRAGRGGGRRDHRRGEHHQAPA